MLQGMQDQFNVSFSPGGPGQIMDLQGAFDRQNAPPAPAPAPAMSYTELPRISGSAGADSFNPLGSTTLGDRTNLAGRFDDAVGPKPTAMETSVVSDLPQFKPGDPGVTAGLPTEQPATKLATNYVATEPPDPLQVAMSGIKAPRQTPRGLGGLLNIPSLTGLLSNIGAKPSFAWSGASGTAPYGSKGGSTNYRSGTVNNIGNGNSLTPNANVHQWNTTNGNQSVTVVQDPWTGTYYQPTYGSPI
jgi:hypothetical protein